MSAREKIAKRVDRADFNAALRIASVVGALELLPVKAIPAEVLFRSTRGGEGEAFARHKLIYHLNTACGRSLNRVAAAIGRDRSTVSYAVRAIEDRRDEPGFDANLDREARICAELVEFGREYDLVLAEFIARAQRTGRAR